MKSQITGSSMMIYKNADLLYNRDNGRYCLRWCICSIKMPRPDGAGTAIGQSLPWVNVVSAYIIPLSVAFVLIFLCTFLPCSFIALVMKKPERSELCSTKASMNSAAEAFSLLIKETEIDSHVDQFIQQRIFTLFKNRIYQVVFFSSGGEHIFYIFIILIK